MKFLDIEKEVIDHPEDLKYFVFFLVLHLQS